MLCACSLQPTSSAAAELRVVTYNVLASRHQDAQRWPALFAILKAERADVLCLQEVVPEFLDALREQPWFRERYAVPTIDGLDALPNGNTICSRFPITRAVVVEHRGPQRRKSLLVDVAVDGDVLTVATCHLESRLTDGAIRARQLADVFRELRRAKHALFAGDFNFGDGEQPDSAAVDADYTDVWTKLRGEDPGYTWNIERSAMAARGSFKDEPSRRIDRVLLRSLRWQPLDVCIVGDEAIDAACALFPSDHFGLSATLRSRR